MSEPAPWARNLRPQLAELSIYDVPPAPAARALLHANECPEPWPPEVMDDLAELVRQIPLGRYPDTSGRALRALLATRHGCDPDRVVLGNGSDEIISFILTALSGRAGTTVVLPRPTFVMYAHSARVVGMAVREVDLTRDLELDTAAMDAALASPDAAVCFLARPNNPTGSLWDAALIEELIARHRHVVFVIDEAYVAYSPGSSLWRPDLPDNVVHMGTLSKVGLAALRVGYCVASPELATALHKVRHPYNLSQTSLMLAHRVLTRHQDAQEHMLTRARAGRERLAAILSRLPGARVFPSAGNMILTALPSPAAARNLVTHLAQRGIRIKDLTGTPGLDPCAGHVRVSVGTAEELDLLEAALAEHAGA